MKRLKISKKMRDLALARFAETKMKTYLAMEEFEHLLEMPIDQMNTVDQFNLVMYGAVASGLNENARPDGKFGTEADYLNELYYEVDEWSSGDTDDTDQNLLLISIAPLNPAILLDGIIGRETSIAMGYFMALRYDMDDNSGHDKT